MGRSTRLVTYAPVELADQIQDIADDRDQSVSDFLKEAARRELQREEVEA